MKLLHNRSILDCSELEEGIHQAETERLVEVIEVLPNYDCTITIIYEDSYHSRKYPPRTIETSLSYYQDVIEQQDLKNGVDIFLTDDNHLAFRTYGQGYTYQGKLEIITSLITVKCYGEGMVPIDMSKIVDYLKPELMNDLSIQEEEYHVSDLCREKYQSESKSEKFL